MARIRDGKPYLSHVERTATEPRDEGLHSVTLAHINQISDSVRLLRLDLRRPDIQIKFRPGQWLDVYVPDSLIEKPGGFTVTSPPACADPAFESAPYMELAVQNSPRNPPAAWLWQIPSDILGRTLHVRLGGSFVWPPVRRANQPALGGLRRVVMIAGGVGINPLISMLSHLLAKHQQHWPVHVTLMYACKPAANLESVLFLSRLISMIPPLDLQLFFGTTSETSPSLPVPPSVRVHQRRMALDDVVKVHDQGQTCFYVCGPQKMTDAFVAGIKAFHSVDSEDVLCEKWW